MLFRSAIYMRQHIGEIFEATVSAFVGSGVFVTLDSPFVDVLIRLEALGSEYSIDDSGLFAAAARSGERISLGDAILVLIEDVAVERRTIYGRLVRPQDAPSLVPPRSDPPGKKRRVKRTGTTAAAPAK